MKKYNKVAVGGTFDKFHKGHETLISTAFEVADNVLIGITSDDFVKSKKHDIEPCNIRIKRLKKLVEKYDTNYEIKEINDVYGSADTDPDLDAIVVSHETETTALDINNIRVNNGLNPLDIIVIEWVLAADGVPISSTRIRKGEIDKKGNIL
ncbi:phosphopantetheine adenylyltransferase [Methanosphaera sp. BMS]|uniref:phosphopantetheine adenylyltransferase n=1 Tax=Methanosphaera sp. BMS TaxID=1789762 RepID=UPI000DC1E64E|nr:phosphopantetheine adenylyltransferase [Methanosphaera sp. BMS]AWX32268.1 phosphopantetheine adenylyltransferase [Methanosphaera sp. BMS]MBR3213444.1 phosphopantetheine adenylyltransferase [Methanosphaera sp.]